MKALLWLVALAPSVYPAVHYVTVAGLGGEAEYEQRFNGQATELEKLLKASSGEIQVHTLSGKEATRAGLTETLQQVAKEARASDSFVLVLIGHGSFDGDDYKFNLTGPDVSGVELAALCDRVPATRQLIVNTTSASGAMIAALQKPGRALITATKSGTEKNATVFGRYFVEAFRDPSADADKNEIVTALEAFRFADRGTVGFYETQKRLSTEHALVEDTGQGEGVRAPSVENGQGALVSSFALLRLGAAQKAAADPAKKQLLARREELEQKIDKLKYEKAALPSEEYRKQLSAMLLELARVQEDLEK
ncbi:MAG: hypothetical protein JJE04_21570 [Acidobacteriia bacterium]|nr:hypothetical protein [Terriglobia bacterium]